MRTTSAILLAVGFILTTIGGWWNMQSAAGANFGAAGMFLLGALIGAFGLALLVISLIRDREHSRIHAVQK